MTTTVKASASRLVAFSLTMLLPVVSLASPPVCGDVNQSGTVTASDALEVLKKAVQQPVDLVCPAPAGPLITGQTACFDPDGGTIFCNGTREDGDVQAGVSRSYTDNGDGTITDNRTGLMWEKLSNDGSIHDRDALMAWGNAFTKIQSLNTANFAGHDDWRLPNVIELTTLVNYGTQIPAISAAFASDCPQDCTVLTCSCIGSQDPIGYWTSTTYENGSNGSGAWAILFAGGFNGAVDKSFSAYVRAVRNADQGKSFRGKTVLYDHPTPDQDLYLQFSTAGDFILIERSDAVVADLYTGEVLLKIGPQSVATDWAACPSK